MKIVFMGTPHAAVPSLERLTADGHEVAAVYTQPDRPSGRGNKVTFSPVKHLASVHGLEICQPSKIRTDDVFQTFRSHAADLAVVVAYGRILPADFLTAFPHGAINLHFSLLPKYRGAAPVNWAIVNGETETGVTTIKMDVGLDTGDILTQRATAIEPGETAIELMARLSEMGAQLLSETLSSLSAVTPTPQDHEQATLAPIMQKEDGRIDWQLSAAQISNRIRGFQPFPSTFTYMNGERLTLWRGYPTESADSPVEAGAVVEAHGDTLVVGCGSRSLLKIEELQPEGKRRMTTRDFLNGARIVKADVLGKEITNR